MAKFCTQCGRPLAEGEICQCQMNYKENNGAGNQANTNAGPNTNNTGNYTENYAGNTANNSYQGTTQDGAYRPYNGGQGYGGTAQEGIKISTEDWVPIRKLLGFGESDYNDVEGCFERGKQIVPELVAPGEGEIPVKQYHVCNARARGRGLWQEGRIQVTNKRVLFRLSGRTWIGRAMQHAEFDINEIAGVSISNGVRFALWDFMIGLIISLIAAGIGQVFGALPAVLVFILGIALMVPFFIIKKKFLIKALILAASAGMLMSNVGKCLAAWKFGFVKFGTFLTVVTMILFFIALFLYALKPALSIQVMTKCASASPIYIWHRQSVVSAIEILPGEDADEATEELGSLIHDIQSMGMAGVSKWREE